jgi:hypothetical protein
MESETKPRKILRCKSLRLAAEQVAHFELLPDDRIGALEHLHPK